MTPSTVCFATVLCTHWEAGAGEISVTQKQESRIAAAVQFPMGRKDMPTL